MTTIISPTYETLLREALIFEVMLLIVDALAGDDHVSSWDLAARIVEKVKPSPVNPRAAVIRSTQSLNPALMAMVKASRAKHAP
jgi:hypothetical protein